MDSKTKHRILGILVLAGLIVLMLPFFQSNHEFSGTNGVINPPPFPEQVEQASTKADVMPVVNTEGTTPINTVVTSDQKPNEVPNESISSSIDKNQKNPAPGLLNTVTGQRPQSKAEASKLEHINTPQKTAQNTSTVKAKKDISLKEMDDEVVPLESAQNSPSTPSTPTHLVEESVKILSEEDIVKRERKEALDSVINSIHMQAREKSQPVKSTASAKITPAKLAATKAKLKANVVTSDKNTLATNKTKSHRTGMTALKRLPIENDGLFKLKQAAYVVQFGSFKDKTHALQLVNRLRAKGYHAFIQQYRTHKGNTIDVFVGPEKKHGSARMLAKEIEGELHVHGMIVSYKPLSL